VLTVCGTCIAVGYLTNAFCAGVTAAAWVAGIAFCVVSLPGLLNGKDIDLSRVELAGLLERKWMGK